MRTWIGGGCLAAVTLAAMAFVLTKPPHPSHVGPCVAGTCNVPVAPRPISRGPDVVDVVAPGTLLGATPADVLPEPRRLPFINFDEPPLAAVVQASASDGPDRIPLATD